MSDWRCSGETTTWSEQISEAIDKKNWLPSQKLLCVFCKVSKPCTSHLLDSMDRTSLFLCPLHFFRKCRGCATLISLSHVWPMEKNEMVFASTSTWNILRVGHNKFYWRFLLGTRTLLVRCCSKTACVTIWWRSRAARKAATASCSSFMSLSNSEIRWAGSRSMAWQSSLGRSQFRVNLVDILNKDFTNEMDKFHLLL